LISLKVKCPVCSQSLMDYTNFLNAKPSIRLQIAMKDQAGIIHLCSTYGCYDKSSSINLPDGEVAKLQCPSCKNDLATKVKCDVCNAPMANFELEKGGKVHVCSRIGCEKHFVSFEDIYATLTSFYEEYDYGAREADF